MKQTALLIALLSVGCCIYHTADATATMPAKNADVATNTMLATPMPASDKVDCDYVVKGDIGQLSPEIITQWATHATVRTFSYDFKNLHEQFQQLKNCYTPEGWRSFSKAVQASKNVQTVKQEQLTVSAQADGASKIINSNATSNTPSWEVSVPIKVTYKNATHNVSQNLAVKVTISSIKSMQSKLGISQIIAAPQQPAATAATAPASTSSATQSKSHTAKSSTAGVNQ